MQGALARVNERQETLASRVFESLAAADERRNALQVRYGLIWAHSCYRQGCSTVSKGALIAELV